VEDLLGGIAVLELSTQVSGAYCGRLLHLLGASVTRWNLPLTADCPGELLAELSASLNDGKAVVAADAFEVVLARARSARLVVCDSLADDSAESAVLREVVTAMGPSASLIEIVGDQADPAIPTSAITVSAAAAMSWGLGSRGQEPLTLPYDLPDYFAGVEAAGAAILELLTGTTASASLPASRWQISAVDVVTSFVGQVSSVFLPYERPWHRDGARANKSSGFYPGAMFPCSDGHITLVCRTDREWTALRAAMGNPEWSRRPEFADAREVARAHADEADRYLTAWTRAHTRDEIIELGRRFGFPHSLVLTVDQAVELEQFAHHHLFEAKASGRSARPGRPWRVSAGPLASRASRPLGLQPSERRPLEGLRVLDLSWVWAGPMLTAELADLGAEIIKIESRHRPDPSRLRGPAIRAGRAIEGPSGETSPYFNQMNRGKRSVAINIGDEEGAELVRGLAQHCDVVVENMRPGALERRGLGYAQLAARNPSIVMVSMSMMGQEGPMKSLGGYAPMMSGLAGLDSLVGYSDDDLVGIFNPSIGDPNGAAHALAVLMAALVYRQRTGRGSWVDLAQIECLVAILRAPILLAASRGKVPPPANTHHVFWPHGTFRTAGEDAWLSLAVRSDAERERLAGLVGADPGDRPGLEAAVTRWLTHRDAVTTAQLLRAKGIPAAAVADLETIYAADWPRRRRLYRQYLHPYIGEQPVWNLTWKRDGESFATTTASPQFGASTEGVFAELLGLGQEELADLRRSGALG
jgi:crotonobetainyl-CoA:carnitine CoA-transferase CaiB-like acyl-CoA transferase